MVLDSYCQTRFCASYRSSASNNTGLRRDHFGLYIAQIVVNSATCPTRSHPDVDGTPIMKIYLNKTGFKIHRFRPLWTSLTGTNAHFCRLR